MSQAHVSVVLKLAIESDDPQFRTFRVAQQGGWIHQQTLPADAENALEIIWRHAQAPVELRFIQDDIAGQAYLALAGAALAVVAVEAGLRSSLPLTDLAEVLSRNRRALPGEMTDHLSKLPGLLAVLGPDVYDPAVMHAVADLLESSNANVRLRTLTAMARLGWPELRPLVTAVAHADEQDFVRWRAADLLLAYDRVAGQ